MYALLVKWFEADISVMASNHIALKADRLRTLREKHGWSKRELALLCGIGENQVLKYERGENDPSCMSLKLIAEKLDVSTDYLLGITELPRGHIGDDSLNEEEQDVLQMFRQEGWSGVARLGVERLSK